MGIEIRSGYITPDERKEVDNSLHRRNFKSDFDLFGDHSGFIDGELHTFVGTKGSGKSTWSKTILSELIYQDKKVFLYLSEENAKKYLKELNMSLKLVYKNEDQLKQKIEDTLIVCSELDDKDQNYTNSLTEIYNLITTCDIDIFIFDNFTTSYMSELTVSLQSAVLRKFKALAEKVSIPVLMFFHTSKLSDPKRLDGDNVRGSATAINIGSYNYLISQVATEAGIRNFVYTEKARYHSGANKKMYEMEYNSNYGIFSKCKRVTMNDYQEALNPKSKGFS